MFSVDELVSDCQAALQETNPQLAVRDILERTLSRPSEVAEVLAPERAEIVKLHASDELTLIKVVWAPGQALRPHDHRMWAVIGIYGGQEDNAFFRRGPGGLVPSGGRVIADRDVLVLGDDAIHSVTNPLRSYTAAIHVYGGDFFTKPRSEWDPDTLEEGPLDVSRVLGEFESFNTGVQAS
jgi:predicted metal-dependent enzyme (double-stranded beta helix superfamily)